MILRLGCLIATAAALPPTAALPVGLDEVGRA